MKYIQALIQTKKIHTKYEKIYLYEKDPHENYPCKKKFWVKWSLFSVIQKRHALSCPGLYRFIFQSLHHQNRKFLKLLLIVYR